MKNITFLNKKLVFFLIIFIFIGGGLFWLYKVEQFNVAGTNPTLNNISSITPFLKVNFNETVATKSISISGSGGIVKSYNAKGDTVTVLLQNMQKGTSYTITIHSTKSTWGGTVQNKILTLKTNNVAYAYELPKDQQKFLLNKQQAARPADISDPILAHLPYTTVDYNLSALITTNTNNQPQLVIQAQLTIFPGNLVNGSEADTIASHKQEVVSYIKSLKLNPANYNIQYQVVIEQLTGH